MKHQTSFVKVCMIGPCAFTVTYLRCCKAAKNKNKGKISRLIKKKNLTIFIIFHQRNHFVYYCKMFHVPLHA